MNNIFCHFGDKLNSAKKRILLVVIEFYKRGLKHYRNNTVKKRENKLENTNIPAHPKSLNLSPNVSRLLPRFLFLVFSN